MKEESALTLERPPLLPLCPNWKAYLFREPLALRPDELPMVIPDWEASEERDVLFE